METPDAGKDSSEKTSRHIKARAQTAEARWMRLNFLLGKTQGKDLAALTDAEIEELSKLYRAATTRLALLRAFGASARAREELNQLVSRGHSALYGNRKTKDAKQRWLWHVLALPLSIRKTAQYHLLAAVLLVAGGIYGYWGTSRDPGWALEFSFGQGDERTPFASREELRQTLVEGRPGSSRDLSAGEKSLFAAQLWRHNTQVALFAFFAGFLFGVPTVLLAFYNGVILGVYTYTFHTKGLAYEWWAWVLPHGITELGAVVLLCGGGIWIGRLMLFPGEKSRFEAIREHRGDIARILFLAFPALLLAAIFESFVRQSGLSDPARYVFAFVTAVAWVFYIGLFRPSTKQTERILNARTSAEAVVPLPEDEDLIRFLRQSARPKRISR